MKLIINSMTPLYLFFYAVLIYDCLGNKNLMQDGSFQQYRDRLVNLYNSGVEEFLYIQLDNGETEWYSLISEKIKIRTKNDLNTVVMQTVNNNLHQKVCRNFSGPLQLAHQLSFDYLIDRNTFSAIFMVSFNDQVILYSQASNRQTYTHQQQVSLSQQTNILCIEGWTDPQRQRIGVLMDNLSLVPFEQQAITLEIFFIEDTNFVRIQSNFTVTLQQQFLDRQNQYEIHIDNVQYRLVSLALDQNKNIFAIVEILEQYASSIASVKLTVPKGRNINNQPIEYTSIEVNLPLRIVPSKTNKDLLTSLQTPIALITKIFFCFVLVTKIVSFSFVGINFMHIYTVFGFMWVMIGVGQGWGQTVIGKGGMEQGGIGINLGVVGLFSGLRGKERVFWIEGDRWIQGNQFLEENSISSNLYVLLIDNLIFALFNIIKLFIFDKYIFNKNWRVKILLKQIKKQRILLQFLYPFAIVAFILPFVTVHSFVIDNFGSKTNRFFIVLIPIFIVFFSCTFLLQQNKKLNKNVKITKMRHSFGNLNGKRKMYYQFQSLKNFFDYCSFFIVPFLVGVGHKYSALSVTFLLCLLKTILSILCLKNKVSLVNFTRTISSTVLSLLICSLFCIKIFESSVPLSPQNELNWLIFLTYNTYFLIFGLLSSGFFEISLTLYFFVFGCYDFGKEAIQKYVAYRKQKQIQQQNYKDHACDQMVENQDPKFSRNITHVNKFQGEESPQSRKSIDDVMENPFAQKRITQKKLPLPILNISDIDSRKQTGLRKSSDDEKKTSSKSVTEVPKSKKVKRTISISRFLDNDQIDEQQQQQTTAEQNLPMPQTTPNVYQNSLIQLKKSRKKKAYNAKGMKIIKKFDPSLKQITQQSEGPDTTQNIPGPQEHQEKFT